MEVIGFIMALLVFCGICSAVFENLGFYKMQKYFALPFQMLARIVLLPFELIIYLVFICFLDTPFIRKEGRARGKRKKNSNNVAPQMKQYTIWRMLFNSLIIAIVLFVVYSFSPFELVNVSSSSMEPTLPVNSFSIAIKSNEKTEYQVGDIITFSVEYGGTYYSRVTHRIVAIDGDTIQTKGDDNAENDPFTIHKSQIQNRVKWQNIFSKGGRNE